MFSGIVTTLMAKCFPYRAGVNLTNDFFGLRVYSLKTTARILTRNRHEDDSRPHQGVSMSADAVLFYARYGVVRTVGIMTFYHVLLTLHDSQNPARCMLSDDSEKKLRSCFIRPYQTGSDILLGSDVIHTSDIRKVQIIRTERPETVERDALNEASLAQIAAINAESDSCYFLSAGSGYEPEDIVDAGQDVTADFIQGPPGTGFTIRSLFSHPWVVTIGAGLVLAALVT